ncbi:MAG: UPF0280 family protein [Thermoplasmata archaeon]|nr:UPF0280 family protein [Thermoplasmata archaeon]
MSGFVSSRFEIGETAATIAGDSTHIPRATEAIARTRDDIERQIARDPFFLTTFEPYDRGYATSEVTRRMCEASFSAGVGPMATVAGTIAQLALEAMVEDGCEHGWVDNGGDIALSLHKPTVVEVFCEPGSTDAFGFEIGPTDGIIGVCSSSGRLGHSISLGRADVAVAIAESAILADALATSMCNAVRTRADLSTCFESFTHIDGFIGGLVVLDGDVATGGRVPKIIDLEHNPDKVTAHSMMSSPSYTGNGLRIVETGQEVRP